MSTPAICPDTGLRRALGKPALYQRFMRIFQDEQQEVCRQIAAALDRQALPVAIGLAHGLVSRAGLIGAGELSRLASELEEALRDADLVQGMALAQALSAEHARVMQAIDAHLAQA